MVVGSSGVSGLFEKFRDRVRAFIISPTWDNQTPTLETQIENITSGLNNEYCDRLSGSDFDVLLGVKTQTGAILKYIYPFGFAEGVRSYKAIGHGEPYGSFFLKRWWHKNMTMLQVAELGFFVIKYIEEFRLDNTVGVGEGRPQIWLIPEAMFPSDATPEQKAQLNPHPPTEQELATMEANVSERIARFKKLSWSL